MENLKLIATNNALSSVVDFGHDLLFEGVSTYTILLFLSKEVVNDAFYIATKPSRATLNAATLSSRLVHAPDLEAEPWLFHDVGEKKLFDKVDRSGKRLLDLPAKMSRGSSTGADNVFMVERKGRQFVDREG
jgi:hypothetical protein